MLQNAPVIYNFKGEQNKYHTSQAQSKKNNMSLLCSSF